MKALLAWLMLGVAMSVSAVASAAPAAPAATKIFGGPAPGLWWNPNESGRGYTFDLQGNLLVMTSYVYTQQGAPTWYISVGNYSYASGQMSASFDADSGGQCLGCSYKQPIGLPNAGGAMKVVFDSAVSGTLYFNGGSTHIERQLFGFANLDAFLYGELQMAYNAGGLVGGDWFLFFTPYTASDGTKYIAGNLDGCTSCAVLGRYDPTLKAWTMIDKVGSYYTFYEVGMDDRRITGLSWIYQTTLSGNGTVSVGSRLLAKDELTLSMKSAPQGALRAAGSDADYIARRTPILAQLAAQQAQNGGSVDAATAAAAERLRAAIDAR